MAYSGITKPGLHFNTKLYTGTGSTHNVTGVGFQPSLTWIKCRSHSDDHNLVDAVRGVTKYLQSNSTIAEATYAGNVSAFGTDGFTVGDGNQVNQNGRTFVSWNWLANGAGSSNTDGTTTSTVSANTTAGFSIVSWTGTGANATIGHGLGSTPKMIIAKQYSSNGGTEHWTVFHNSLDTNKNLYLNLTNAEDTPSPDIYRKGSFTNDVFAIGAHDRINNNTVSYIAYCFAEKTGYSKFGSYTGNGNTDGEFIYTGFKPSWVMIKNVSTSNDWFMIDNSRDTLSPNNPVGRKSLEANDSAAEVTRTTKDMDFLSNGIKLRTADGTQNNNNENYIYMAFASEPLVANVGNSIPATAR